MTDEASNAINGELGSGAGLSARGLLVAEVGPDEVVAKRGLAEVRLRFNGVAELLERVTHLADGTISEDTLVESFEPDVQPEVRRLVDGLRARGLIHHQTGDDTTGLFWLSVASHAPEGVARLSRASAVVVGSGPIAASMTSALVECGVGTVDVRPEAPRAGTWDLWCGAVESSPEALLPVAEAALAAGVPFLPVSLDDLVIRVGPLTDPFDTACLRCYLLRVDANDAQREVHRLLRQGNGDGYAGSGFLPPMPSVAGQVAAVEAVKFLTGLPVTCSGRVIEWSLVPFRCDVRRVLRVPRCPACSGVARQGAPVVAHGSQLAE